MKRSNAKRRNTCSRIWSWKKIHELFFFPSILAESRVFLREGFLHLEIGTRSISIFFHSVFCVSHSSDI